MKIDESLSVYQEDSEARADFTGREMRHLRMLLRRLRFLEAQVRATPEKDLLSNATMFAEKEINALEWILKDVGFLLQENRQLQVSGNPR